jgi:hypothetical protein
MKPKAAAKPKITEADRHKRFVAMAREVEADKSPASFDQAFARVTKAKAKPSKR